MDSTPKQKMGKRAKKALDASARRTWPMSPVTRMKTSKKIYDRKKRRADEDSTQALPGYIHIAAFARRAAWLPK